MRRHYLQLEAESVGHEMDIKDWTDACVPVPTQVLILTSILLIKAAITVVSHSLLIFCRQYPLCAYEDEQCRLRGILMCSCRRALSRIERIYFHTSKRYVYQ